MRDRINGIPLTHVGERVHKIVGEAVGSLWSSLDCELDLPNDTLDDITRVMMVAARKIIARDLGDDDLIEQELAAQEA